LIPSQQRGSQVAQVRNRRQNLSIVRSEFCSESSDARIDSTMSSKSPFSWKSPFGKKRNNKKEKDRAKDFNAESLQHQEEGNDNDKAVGGDILAGELGLISLNPHAVDGAAIEPARKRYHIDIVAVHGLGGDAYKTWTHENGKLWLRDFVPDELPGARIFSYGYNSAFVFSRETGTLRDYARGLLENIRLVRMSPGVSVFQSLVLRR
jgi:hypothetical protein